MNTVIVVDDDDNIRETIVDILQLEGFSTEGFSSADGVLTRLLEGDVSLVVTDLNMPDIDGMELLESIGKSIDRGDMKRVPVILLTGAGFEERAKEALQLGAVDCFAKPFDIDDFVKSVKCNIGDSSSGTGG